LPSHLINWFRWGVPQTVSGEALGEWLESNGLSLMAVWAMDTQLTFEGLPYVPAEQFFDFDRKR
jgi:hypothetical protein